MDVRWEADFVLNSNYIHIMFDAKQFLSAIKQIADEKGIPEEKILSTVEEAIAAAYKRDYGEKSQIIKAKLDRETGDVAISRARIVVEGFDADGYVTGELPVVEEDKQHAERVSARGVAVEDTDVITDAQGRIKVKYNPEKYITIDEAKEAIKNPKVGERVITNLEPKSDFGRIAAQTAKQVVIQRLREIEREAIFEEFKEKEGMIVSGLVQRIEGRIIYIDLGRTNGILLPTEQLYSDSYRLNQRLRFLLVRVEQTSKGPVLYLSRAHPRLVMKLFEFEVPEIETGAVEIKAIAREAGSRSKIAVISHEDGVDPIGSLVGQKGVRVQTVINELNGEKIDIIEWNELPERYISQSLSPAKIIGVKILSIEQKHALAEVAEDQFSLAIGKKGQNVRLAAKLTGWKIDVRAPQSALSASESLADPEIADTDVQTLVNDAPDTQPNS